MQKADLSPNSSAIEAGNLGQAKRIYQGDVFRRLR